MKELGLSPTPQQRRLLEAALLGADQAVAAWRRWRAQNAPDAVDRGSRRLFPLVYHHLRESGVAEDELYELEPFYVRSREGAEWKLRDARPVVAALVEAGIDLLVLKGTALARFYAGDAGLRPMADIDLLVRTPDAARAAAVLSALGYAPSHLCWDCLSRFAFRRLHARSFVAPGRPEIDLHWHALHDSCEPDADEDFWEGAVPIDLAGITVKALNATDQLLHVFVHALHPEKFVNLRWWADAMHILRHDAEPIDWQRLLAQAVRRRLVLQVRHCLRSLKSILAAPIPEEAIRAFDRARTTWLERIELRARTQRRARGALARAVVAYQDETRRGRPHSLGALLRFLPRHLWGARAWWQMPAWTALDWLGLSPAPGASLTRRLFAPAVERFDAGPSPYSPGQRLAFCCDGNGLAALRAGWSYAERGGVWSDGALARLELRVDGDTRSALRLEAEIAAALVGGSKPSLDVHVLVNSTRVACWRFVAPIDGPTTRLATIPRGVLPGAGPCVIDFRILRPRSPASLGMNEDERLLGVHLSSLRLFPAPESERG